MEAHVNRMKEKSARMTTSMCREAGNFPRLAIKLFETIIRATLEHGRHFLVNMAEPNRNEYTSACFFKANS